jgi:hypothetical protein
VVRAAHRFRRYGLTVMREVEVDRTERWFSDLACGDVS